MATEQENPTAPEEPVAGQRGLVTDIELGLLALDVAAPFVAPYVPDVIDKLTGPKDEGPHVIIPPGVHPEND
jgi:hypothetical protein